MLHTLKQLPLQNGRPGRGGGMGYGSIGIRRGRTHVTKIKKLLSQEQRCVCGPLETVEILERVFTVR